MYEIKLSPYHQIFYNEWKLNPTGTNYNIVFDQTLSTALNISQLKGAIKRFINDFLILNSHVIDNRGKATWIKNNEINQLKVYNKPHYEDSMNQLIKTSFDLEEGPLYRFAIFRNKSNHYRLIMVFHHIVISGESFDELLDEIANYYNDPSYKTSIDLNDQIKFINSAISNLNKKLSTNSKMNKSFWHTALDGVEPINLSFLKRTHSMSIDYERSQKIGEINFSFGSLVVQELNLLKSKYGLSGYAYGRIIFAIILNKYSSQNDFGVSYPLSIKEQTGLVYGATVNTNIIPYHFSSHQTVNELIEQNSLFFKQLKECNFAPSYYPINEIFSNSDKKLLQVFFANTNLKNSHLGFDGVDVISINHQFNIDLAGKVIFEEEERNKILNYRVKFDKVEIDEVILSELVKNYVKLFAEILKDLINGIDDKPLYTYSLLNEREYHQIVYEWNTTDKLSSSKKTLYQLFEEQVDRTPRSTAIVYKNKKLTYHELNKQSNQVAHYLKSNYGVCGEDIIPFCLDRDESGIIAILGILKAGGAYVPIDPNYPQNRINYIIKDISPKVIITNQAYVKKFPKNLASFSIMMVDDELTRLALESCPFSNLSNSAAVNNLAYVMYTSGTTGVPKGVMVEHESVTNTLTYLSTIHDYHQGKKRATCFSSYVFDVSIAEIFTPLLNGGELHLLEEKHRQSIDLLKDYLLLNKINYVYLPPAILALLPHINYPDLELIIFAGEPCNQEVGSYWASKVKLYNYYGPTESAIYVTGTLVNPINVNEIGKPIFNMHAYVLDGNFQPVPIGAVGELYVSGVGLSRGYWKQPELTEEKFLNNPFLLNSQSIFCSKHSKIYKSGDLVRLLRNGNLEYIGRVDEQVKIRGQRTELGEIESVLNAHAKISQSIVVTVDNKNNSSNVGKLLVAYYVSSRHVMEDSLFEHLKHNLPYYMIPNVLVRLKHIPLTINGKVDKRALPLPKIINDAIYIAPRNDLERKICKAFAEILEINENDISIEEDFFRLGGNSILAIKLSSIINTLLYSNLTASDIFHYRQIDELAEYLSGNNSKKAIEIEKLNDKGAGFLLSYAQERLWFIEQYTEDNIAYNLPLIFEVAEGTNKEFLKQSIISIIYRHEVLRTLIKQDEEGNARQIIMPLDSFHIEESKFKSKKLLWHKLFEDIKQPYRLDINLPVRVGLYEYGRNLYLSFIVHHIVFDAWSIDIFLDEINKFYKYYVTHNLPKIVTSLRSLPKLTIQYKDFAQWQREHLGDDELHHQLSYWKAKLQGYEEINLIKDSPRPKQFDYLGFDNHFSLGKDISNGLRKLSHKLGITLYSLLLSGYYLFLRAYSNQNDLTIGTPMANRHYNQVESLIGFFVNMVPLRITIDSEQLLTEFIKEVSTEVITAQIHQDIPFEKLVMELDVNKDMSRNPIFQIMFTLQRAPTNKYGLLSPYSLDDSYNIAKFDLSLTLDDAEEEIKGVFNYASSLFESNTINRYIRTYTYILKQFADVAKTDDEMLTFKVKDLSYLNPKDYQKIVIDYNKTFKEFPSDKTIHQLFEEQVKKTPNNIAVIFNDVELTYQELNIKANQLANYLIMTFSIQPDDSVALCLERNENIIIAILAVLKSGGAYVPIDLSYPFSRIEHILNDCAPKVLLTNGHSKNTLIEIINHSFPEVGILDLENEKIRLICSALPINNLLLHQSKPHNLAYVIYTSGTSGGPKGVMIEHRSAINTIYSIQEVYNFTDNCKKVLCFTAYVFDVFVAEIFVSLINGGELYLLDEETRYSPDELSAYLNAKKINYAYLPPAILRVIPKISYPNLRSIIFAGEKCDQKTGEFFCKNFNFYNYYGPTEASIYALGKNVDKRNINEIGTPIYNMRAYILDDCFRPVPVGAVGELYIGGVGLARGYLNLDSLNKEKFKYLKVPYKGNKIISRADCTSQRLYKTGDLVRMLPDGNLEYLGRNDLQIKIRGQRIEIEEIENILKCYPRVEQSIVVAASVGSKDASNQDQLIAYYTSKNIIEEIYLKEYLGKYLPQYMVPQFFLQMDKIPLTINGKLDRKLLSRSIDSSTYYKHIGTKSRLENEISTIWAQLLNLPKEQIGIRDSFFKLGGNSLSIVKLKTKLCKLDGFETLKLADLFEYVTIEQLTQFRSSKNPNNQVELVKNDIYSSYEIAIISISGAFSGCNDINDFWQLIKEGKEGIKRSTLKECREYGVKDELLYDEHFVPSAGIMPGTDQFDPTFWGVSTDEAKRMDPQLRKLLEHCWHLLEQSGYLVKRTKINTGVFAGCGTSKYSVTNRSKADDRVDDYTYFNLDTKDILATTVSYMLGLTGPANTISTACSTSLVAIIEACKNLFLGTCDLAIAGGVSLLLPNELGYVYQEGMVLSKDGQCRVFDKQSTGTVVGSGVGVVLLKRLEDAKRDNDKILAVIKGYATNNDGNRKMNFTAPSVVGQRECILNAQKMAGITADIIDYVECHGTGTKLGDPIELQALDEAFKSNVENTNKNQPNKKCILGAVKANIGHTDTAAGVAGLIKICKMLEDNLIPKQINYNQPNPNMTLEETNFMIPMESCIWERRDNARFAGVSSFGIGGTNAHLIISEYYPEPDSTTQTGKDVGLHSEIPINYVLPISAHNEASLHAYTEKFIDYLSSTQNNIRDIAYALQTDKQEFNHRIAISCRSKEEAISRLPIALKNSLVTKPIQKDDIGNIIILPGQGTQHINMGLDLYLNEEEYKKCLDQCIEYINDYLDVDFKEILFPALYDQEKLDTYNINYTQWAQPALFITSYSLGVVVKQIGIKASAYIGHSVGELVAATLAGVFTLKDAIKLVLARGRLMQSMPEGGMLLIQCNMAEISTILNESNCEIALINAPESFVVSGDSESILHLKNQLDIMGFSSTILNVSHAYHSYMMDEASKRFIKEFVGIKLNKPNDPFISNVTGNFITDEEATDVNYWAKQIRHKVLFADGIETLISTYSNPFFIELGPGKSLLSFIKQINDRARGASLLISSKDNSSFKIFVKEDIISKLWMYGYPIDFKYLYSLDSVRRANLPLYSFDSKRCWQEHKKVVSEDNLNLLSKEKWLSTLVWKKLYKLIYMPLIPKNKDTFLIFKNRHSPHIEAFVKMLNNVYIVECDYEIEEFAIKNNKIIINPLLEDSYKHILTWLKDSSIDPVFIIHAMTLGNKFDLVNHMDNQLGVSFYSVFFIQKYILDAFNKEIKLILLTNGLFQLDSSDSVNPFNGSMMGALRSIRHERTNLKYCVVDIEDKKPLNVRWLLNFIYEESSYREEYAYALRLNSLWVQSLEPIKDTPNKHALIQDDDVILITGGLGGIALSIAKFISGKHKVRFILVSRTDLYNIRSYDYHIETKLNLIESVKKNGSSIDIQLMDVADYTAIENLIAYIIKKHKKLTGVIHSAGMAPLASDDRNLHNIKNAISGKIYGANNLIKAVRKLNLNYFIMNSSLASIMGDVNRIEYCAANSYLDFLSMMNDLLPATQILTINWLGWSDIGLIMQNAQHDSKTNNKLDLLLKVNNVSSIEGGELFYELSQHNNYPQVIVSKLDIPTLMTRLFKVVETNEQDTMSHELLRHKVVEQGLPSLYYQIAEIFLETLVLEKLSIYDSFFDLGGDSLAAIRVIARLKKLGIPLKVSDVLMVNSIDKIYQFHQGDKLKEASGKIIVPLVLNKNAKKNIFLVHPVGGTVMLYLEMVKKLDSGYNYYGIQNINIMGEQLISVDTLEELSKIYLQEILKVQVEGDYIIMGSSMGGTIAFEISRQLMEKGKKVKFVVMFDSWAIFSRKFYNKKFLTNILEEQVQYKNIFKEIDDDSKLLINARWNLMQLLLSYQPKKTSDAIYLFKANDVDSNYAVNGEHYDNGWQQYTSEQLHVYNVQGNHVTIHAEPGLNKIIEVLNQILKA